MYRILAVLLAMTILMGAAGAWAEEAAVMQRGDEGEHVLALQKRLAELGYLEETDLTGVYDENTEEAVYAFQSRNGLLKTGMADPVTREKLFSEEAAAKEYEAPWEYEVLEDAFYEAAPAAAMPGPTGYAMNSAQYAAAPKNGGPQWNTSEYRMIREQGFISVSNSPLSTFQADVDTSAYTQIRADILAGRKVDPDKVRIEEMLNYFRYDYAEPAEGEPFGVTMELAPCPWNAETMLLQIGLKAQSVKKADRPRHNLVFLIDTSGSMDGEDRLDLVKRAFLLLLEALDPEDTVSIVTYASMDTVVLEGVPARERGRVMEAIEGLYPHGSTNGTAGLIRAYEVAQRCYIEGGVNRILMATDGDLNTGSATSEGDLARLVMEKKRGGVELTMLGFGYGNFKDNKMEALADYGDGNCWYIDNVFEARRALVTEADGTFVTVARDVKLQVDFNPAFVSAYRLIGYEHKLLDAGDFADDEKDGGDVGSGHSVTALYEIVPAGSAFMADAPQSKYAQTVPSGESGEWLTVNIRYKAPGSEKSELLSYPLEAADLSAPEMTDNLRFAAAVAETGMLLRDSEFKGSADYASAAALLREAGAFVLGDPLKEEFLYLVTLLERDD